ncbi:hypothetical protein BT96DRAFT_449941 [Gymnopus androsaceus JB14]|uniref:Uncharacterized protein n=1 Tax=Gymnopus androsaceus JB14 TaxID=1447944 RepID=A0A6A4GRL3_9AGAR|nr:hypothetical protein BT96DRAFT_449941 [Gymnopus androsaceus JB14]
MSDELKIGRLPYIVRWNRPDFSTVEEVVDFCSQIFEARSSLLCYLKVVRRAWNLCTVSTLKIQTNPFLIAVATAMVNVFMTPPGAWNIENHLAVVSVSVSTSDLAGLALSSKCSYPYACILLCYTFHD